MKNIIRTESAPLPIGPYSQAVRSGDILFVSGQLGMIPGESELLETVEDQTRQALTNLLKVLKEAGMNEGNVVKTTCFLAEMSDFADFNAVYQTVFTSEPPARSCFAVKQLPLGAKVEIEAIACR